MRNLFPKGSQVCFEFDGEIHTGTVLVVDYRDGDVSECFGLKNSGYTYDIEVKNENMLYKHLPEFVISSVENENGSEGIPSK